MPLVGGMSVLDTKEAGAFICQTGDKLCDL